jgi:protein required for attachment to host cells
MYRVCIAIVDATRARLFTFERTLEAEATTHEELREHTDLVNPARRRPGESFTDSAGTNRVGGLQYTFDDHRDAFVNNLEAEFARTVIAELQRLLDAAPARRLIVCASPRMLGELRAVGVPRRAGLVVDEVARDLVELRATDLRDRLASYGLLPERPPRPTLARGT